MLYKIEVSGKDGRINRSSDVAFDDAVKSAERTNDTRRLVSGFEDITTVKVYYPVIEKKGLTLLATITPVGFAHDKPFEGSWSVAYATGLTPKREPETMRTKTQKKVLIKDSNPKAYTPVGLDVRVDVAEIALEAINAFLGKSVETEAGDSAPRQTKAVLKTENETLSKAVNAAQIALRKQCDAAGKSYTPEMTVEDLLAVLFTPA